MRVWVLQGAGEGRCSTPVAQLAEHHCSLLASKMVGMSHEEYHERLHCPHIADSTKGVGCTPCHLHARIGEMTYKRFNSDGIPKLAQCARSMPPDCTIRIFDRREQQGQCASIARLLQREYRLGAYLGILRHKVLLQRRKRKSPKPTQ